MLCICVCVSDVLFKSNVEKLEAFSREDAITIKEGKDITLPDSKKVVANIAAHEVAHQWFGNLVTPKWWDDVWLKEGFSTFFGYLALNAVNEQAKR